MLLLTDLLIAVLLVGLPFVMGGREAWGHRLLISSSLALGAIWAVYRVVHGGRLVLLSLEPLLAAGLLLLWVQTTPLPESVMAQLSGEYSRLLPEWGDTQQAAGPAAATSDDSVGGAEAIARTPSWNTASLIPTETRHAFWMLLAYGIVGVVLAQRIRTDSDGRRILLLVAASGALMALFGIIQYVFSNGRFFWVYEHPYTNTAGVLKGAFTNRNHFAQFLSLSIGPLLWWLLVYFGKSDSRIDRRKGLGTAHTNYSSFSDLVSIPRLMMTCLIGGVLVTIALTLSRGGMIAAGVVLVVAMAGLWKSGLGRSGITVTLIALAGLLIVGIVLGGGAEVEHRAQQLATGDADQIDGENARRTIWNADLKAIRAFPLLGTGVGSHRDIYPTYMEDLADFSDYEFSHAESSYIHLALETGLCGFGCLAVGLLTVLFRLGRGFLRNSTHPHLFAMAAACAAGLAGGMLHAVVDFIWYAPAIVVTTIALIVTALRALSGFSELTSIAVPRIAWLGAAAAAGFGLVTIQPQLASRVNGEREWNQYLLICQQQQNEESRDREETDRTLQEIADTTHGSDSENPIHAASLTSTSANEDVAAYGEDPSASRDHRSITSIQERMEPLVRSLRENPDQPRVRLRLAQLCLELFDAMQRQAPNPLPLAHLRDAAVGSQFGSPDDLRDWLERAFGKHVKLLYMADQLSRDSLHQCPVQGNAYLYLLETGFLHTPGEAFNEELVSQAMLVRGHDPRIHFAVGKHALSLGHEAEAMEQWQAVFHANSSFRIPITTIMATQVSASYIISNFQPDLEELTDVLGVYARKQSTSDVRQIIDELERQIDHPDKDASRESRGLALMKAQSAAAELKMADTAEHLARRAVELDGTSYWPRRALAVLLFENGRFDEAAPHLLWCHDETPDDSRIEWMYRESQRRSTYAPRTAATSAPTFEDSIEWPE
ncbi:MAG: O-antigen ligase family protein [Planctomycetaceae bacterium]|nr:O-antigen ligase family protein [Planctomycetaceae bacterium]